MQTCFYLVIIVFNNKIRINNLVFGKHEKRPYLSSPNLRDVAQLVECASGGREVAGSSPVIPTNYK